MDYCLGVRPKWFTLFLGKDVFLVSLFGFRMRLWNRWREEKVSWG